MGEVIHLAGDPYWYECIIITRPNGYPVYDTKAGSMRSFSAINALDQVHEWANTKWRGELYRAKVYEIDYNGELVAETTVGEVNSHGVKKPIYTPPPSKAETNKVNAYMFGTYMTKQSAKFPTLKFEVKS